MDLQIIRNRVACGRDGFWMKYLFRIFQINALTLKDNSTMNKTEAQIVSYGILYLHPSSH